jgi:hypothetical protein
MVVARGLVNIKYDIKVNGKFLYVPIPHFKIKFFFDKPSHGQPAARGPHAALEALQCGPSTDSEKRYFEAKSIRI